MNIYANECVKNHIQGKNLQSNESPEKKIKMKRLLLKNSKWIKRAGFAGFMFFLIKGLIWVGLGLAAWIGLS